MLCAPVAYADSFDFANEADINGERAVGLVAGDNIFGLTGGSFLVSVTSGPSGSNPYLDSGNAGLGVCTNSNPLNGINNDQCDPTSDDNAKSGENVTLSFSSDALATTGAVVTISEILFRNETHGIVFVGTDFVMISVDGAAATGYFFNTAWVALTGTTFDKDFVC